MFVFPAVVRGSDAGQSDDGGEPVEAHLGLDGEPDSQGPHCPAELGGRGVEDGVVRPTGDELGPVNCLCLKSNICLLYAYKM